MVESAGASKSVSNVPRDAKNSGTFFSKRRLAAFCSSRAACITWFPVLSGRRRRAEREMLQSVILVGARGGKVLDTFSWEGAAYITSGCSVAQPIAHLVYAR